MTLEELKSRVIADNRDNPAAPEASESAYELWEARNEILALVEAVEKVKRENAGGYIDDDFGEIEAALDAFNAKRESL